MSTTEIPNAITLGQVDTPLDARTRIAALADVESIDNPFVGMIFYAVAEGKSYKVKTLKKRRVGAFDVANRMIDAYEPVPDASDLSDLSDRLDDAAELAGDALAGVEQLEDNKAERSELAAVAERVIALEANPGGGIAALPAATLTIPIPADKDNNVLYFIVDICVDGDFVEEETTHILMTEHRDKMKVSSDGKLKPLPEGGLGTPYYGESVVFTLDAEMLPGYTPGRTYFARYRWLDSKGGRTDWQCFKFTYDFNDARPVKAAYGDAGQVGEAKEASGTLEVDYLNGDIQRFTMSTDVTLNAANIKNVPYGRALIILIKKTDGVLTVVNNYSSETMQTNKTYLIGVVDVGELILTISETIA